MDKAFGPDMEFVLRNREGGWSLEVQMASLEDAAAILSRMGSNGPVTAHIETLNANSGRYVRKGKLEIGAKPSPWRVPDAAVQDDPPPPPQPDQPPPAPPASVGSSFRLLVVSLAQIFFGLFGLILVGAVILYAWTFVSERLGEVRTVAANHAAATVTSASGYTPPRSSPYSTSGLSQENGIYVAWRVDVLARMLRHADACGLTSAREMTAEKFIEPVIRRFNLNAADVALINRQLAVVPESTCSLSRDERLDALAAMTRISTEGIMLEAFGAWGDAMQPSRP